MKFFFYGIFLDKKVRKSYGMPSEATYATIPDYYTFAISPDIVMAARMKGVKLSLSGLVVDVPESVIPALDDLERGYRRETVMTAQEEQVQMYVSPRRPMR